MQPYEKFYNTKSYIRSKTICTEKEFKISEQDKHRLKEMMKFCGFGNLQKFISLKNSWDTLQKAVPLCYLEYLDVKREVLEYTLTLDAELYQEELNKERFPEYASVMLRLGACQSIPIPPGYNEDQAIEFLFLKMEKQARRFRLQILYPGLLAIFLDLPDRINTEYYPPDVMFTEKEMVPGKGQFLKIRRMR